MAVPFGISLDEGSRWSTSSLTSTCFQALCCCFLNFSHSSRYVVVSSYISSLKTNDIEDLFMCSFAVLISAFFTFGPFPLECNCYFTVDKETHFEVLQPLFLHFSFIYHGRVIKIIWWWWSQVKLLWRHMLLSKNENTYSNYVLKYKGLEKIHVTRNSYDVKMCNIWVRKIRIRKKNYLQWWSHFSNKLTLTWFIWPLRGHTASCFQN